MIRLFFILLLLSSLVYAQNAVIGENNEGYWTINIMAAKGWNLLPESGMSAIIFDQTINLKSVIPPMYVYLPIHKKYVVANDGYSQEDYLLVQENQPYLKLTPRWYYFSKETPIPLKVAKEDLQSAALYEGWNFISYAPQIFYQQLARGTCDIQKIYFWNPFVQQWEVKPQNDLFGDNAEDDLVGYGFIIKVKETCSLGKAAPSTPPQIPQ